MRVVESKLCAVLALVMATPVAMAQAETDDGWSGKGEMGLVKTTGNSETESLKFGIQFVKEQEQWRHRVAADALSAEDDGVTTAERYGFEWQTDYKLSDISWVLGAFRYESDEFSAYDNQQTLSFGYGRQLLDNAAHQLVGEIGVGYREAELVNTGLTESGAILRGLLDYSWVVTDNTEFSNRFLVESGSDNTFIKNVAGLTVAMNDKFALGFGIEYRRNSDVPPGVDNTDTITSANLVYNFD
ncbi:MAG: DUF481 domain-containing protein [Xanthomonadales bacterium]|nr:DUF481 domain-containing protein [Xanthomonadales bacterium]